MNARPFVHGVPMSALRTLGTRRRHGRATAGAVLLAAAAAATGEEAPAPAAGPAPAAAAPAAPAPDDLAAWTYKGRTGLFLTNVYVRENAADSPDPAIHSTTSATSYLVSLEGALGWKRGPLSLDQELKIKYGRLKQAGSAWQVNNDESRYDGVFRYELEKPTFIYGGWGAQTVLRGPDPENSPFDPFTAHASAGLGQIFQDLLVRPQPGLPDDQREKNRLEWRLGVRIEKRWGTVLVAPEGNFRIGPEAYLRYEHQLSKDLRLFVQGEGQSEFKDLAHVTALVTAGLTAQLSTYLSADLGFRAYYEARPRQVDQAPGYNEWAIRQDTLLGLVYSF